MIKRVKIQEFQSHRDSVLEFSPIDTVIVGTSDSGKSAILRAIEWVRTNRPRGDSFIRTGNREPCRVELTIERGGKEITIARQKSDKTNQYEIPGEVFKALGSDVPEPVTELLNLGDINVQHQLDVHFLVLDAPGKIAQFINGITKIEEADECLSRIAGKVRQINSDIKLAQDTISKKEIELSAPKFQVLDEFEQLINLFSSTKSDYQKSSADRDSVAKCCEKLQYVDSQLEQLRSKLIVKRLLKDCEERIACVEIELKRTVSDFNRIASITVDISAVNSSLHGKQEELNKLQELSVHLNEAVVPATELCELSDRKRRLLDLHDHAASITAGLIQTKTQKEAKQLEDQTLMHATTLRSLIVSDSEVLRKLSEIVMKMRSVDLSMRDLGEALSEKRSQFQALIESVSVCPVCGQDIASANAGECVRHFFQE